MRSRPARLSLYSVLYGKSKGDSSPVEVDRGGGFSREDYFPSSHSSGLGLCRWFTTICISGRFPASCSHIGSLEINEKIHESFWKQFLQMFIFYNNKDIPGMTKKKVEFTNFGLLVSCLFFPHCSFQWRIGQRSGAPSDVWDSRERAQTFTSSTEENREDRKHQSQPSTNSW